MSETKTAYQQLTAKQRRFVDAYIGDEAFGNAAKAARLAGYAVPKQAGWEVRNHPGVQAAIDEQLQQRVPTKYEVLTGIGRLTRGSMLDFIDVGGCDLSEEAQQLLSMVIEKADLVLHEVRAEGGLPLGVPELIEQKREELQALAEKLREAVTKRPWTFNFEKAEREGLLHLIQEIGTTENGATKLKLHDPLKAYEMLGRFYKLFTDKVEHTGPGGGPVIIREVTVEMPAIEDDDEPGEEPLAG